MTKIDNAQGIFCQLVVYQSQASTGNPAADFSSEWNGIVAHAFQPAPEPPPRQSRTTAGHVILECGSTVVQGGKGYFADLMVFQIGDRVQSMLVLSSDAAVFRAFEAQIDAFRASLRSASPPPAPSASTASSAPAAPAASPAAAPSSSGSSGTARPADLGTISGKGITGVWMGFTTVIGQYTPEPRWMTFYDDGQVFTDIPRTGLDGFDRAASRQDAQQVPYWSTFTREGKRGAIVTPGVNYRTVLEAKGPGKITAGADNYYRCPVVDGLRLQGTWTSYADPNDPALDRMSGGVKPVITFTKDGRFVDEGIFAAFLHTAFGRDQSADAPGTGTYSIKAYTLVLSYSDGRTQRVAITGLLSADAAKQSDIIYLLRSRFNKRK